MINAVIADSNKEYLEYLRYGLNKTGEIRVTSQVLDGEALLDAIINIKPQVIVTDIILSKLDGFEILEYIKNKSIQTSVIINTSLFLENIIQRSKELGAAYFIKKNADIDSIAKHIKMVAGSAAAGGAVFAKEESDKTLEDRVSQILKRIGIPVHIRGYKYLKEAVLILSRQPEAINGITTLIYPKISQMFSTTPERVERSIRYAIEKAFDQGNFAVIYKVFGYTVNSSKGKPSNSQFIAMIADNILIYS